MVRDARFNPDVRGLMRLLAAAVAAASLATCLSIPALAQRQRQAPAEPDPEITVLHGRRGSPYFVVLLKDRAGEICVLRMEDQPSGVEVAISMNGSERIILEVLDRKKASPVGAGRRGSTVPVAIEVNGVLQGYQIRIGQEESASLSLPRATQSHLRKAINQREGFTVRIGNTEPPRDFRFAVPSDVATAFEECVRASLRGRLDQRAQELQQLIPR